MDNKERNRYVLLAYVDISTEAYIYIDSKYVDLPCFSILYMYLSKYALDIVDILEYQPTETVVTN